MKKLTLEQISDRLRNDSMIERLNNRETLSLKDLFVLQRYLSEKIENYVSE